MTLLQLQYFQVLARVLHYTHTAERLHISQPSLSYSINELEKELGVKLFQKKKRKIDLTVYGQQFLPYVEESLSLLEKGQDILKEMSANVEKVVKLGYFHSISASLVPSIVEGFYRKESNQQIRFHFTEGPSYDVLTQLQNGALDLAFSMSQEDWAQSVEIMRQPLYLMVPKGHDLSGRTSVSFLDFAREPQVMLERASSLRVQLDGVFSENGLIPKIVFEVRECNAALQYVVLGFGVSVLPWVPAAASDKIVAIPISDKNEKFVRRVYLSYHKTRRLSPWAQSVLDFIVKGYATKIS